MGNTRRMSSSLLTIHLVNLGLTKCSKVFHLYDRLSISKSAQLKTKRKPHEIHVRGTSQDSLIHLRRTTCGWDNVGGSLGLLAYY